MELNQVGAKFNENRFKNQKCQACKGDTPKFDEKQIIKYLSKLDNWSVNEEQKMIFKKLKFKNFNEILILLIKYTFGGSGRSSP